ncbi:MAG: hypothetical protein K2I71_03780 [Helicobacter sp.]|nr:hypothetical protein [Helicobacter sp.]
MIRTRDYVIPLLLYVVAYYGVILSAFLWGNIFEPTQNVAMFIFEVFLITLCVFYYLYKKQILDWFVGITIIINDIAAFFYMFLILFLGAFPLGGKFNISDATNLIFLVFFVLFIFSFLPLFFTIHSHIHKRKLVSFISLSCMVLATLLFTFEIVSFIIPSILFIIPSLFFLMRCYFWCFGYIKKL